MESNNKAVSYSTNAVTVPTLTFLFGAIIYVVAFAWDKSLTAQAAFNLPLIIAIIIIVSVLVFGLLSVGAVVGFTSAITALRLSKEMSPSDKKKIRIYSILGICISLAEFLLLAFGMLTIMF